MLGDVDQNKNVSPQPVTPVNPEMAAVQANQPAPAATPAPAVKTAARPGAVPPKKIGKEKIEKSKSRFIMGCMGGFIFLFVVFIILMVLMISRSGASNPVMQAFGLDPGGVRNFLQGVVGFAFGILSLLFLILLIIGLFRFLGAQKSDKEKRSRNLRMMTVSSVMLVLMVGIWVVLANYISRIEIAAEKIIAEIVVEEPKDLNNLTAPVEIKFSAINVAKALEMGGIRISSMNWDLDGDGEYETPVTSPEVTHLYARKGTYTVGLQVKVAGEDTYREPYTQIISIPNAAFGAEPSTGTAPLAVEFDASVIISKSNVASLDWDFDGDGVYELEGPDNLRPRYTFSQIGVYKVHLRAIDKNDNVENYYRNIEVTVTDKPIVSAVIDVTPGLRGPIPLQLRFDASRSVGLKGKIIKYQWDFGDGSDLQSGKSTTHVFNKPDFYSVTLSVEDELGNKATSSVEIEAQAISSVPEAAISSTPAFSAGQPLTGTLPFKVEFDASGSQDADNDIVQYEWDFDGDGIVDQEGKKVSHTFETAGTYTVGLTVEDSEDQKSTASMQVLVQEPGVLAVITATPEEGTAPLTVKFDGSSSSVYQGNIVSYEWDFGDASPKTITGAIVSHKYTSVGSYTAKLKVLTNNNESASTSKIIYVREIPLKACFTPSRMSGLAPLTVAFDSKCSTGTVSGYSWQFGDGVESSSKNPTHTFEFPGSYTVVLEVADSKNNVSTYQEIIVAEGDVQ
ncbi:PKD domain-containing protein [Patescibacteria group bacterium]|nr:PKD domain-containing protein [Patescibacteria group bacterium]MBU1016418.1 PKD domain-containing protein [Patescibacteria group bacterium]MBU1685166.1 PKD domain-containing protein [Patescibacteria group bacterium]MBU1938823.1 PKD domain-containing protein [Patescibacteria group bacterium]